MKTSAISEIVFNILKHEFKNAPDSQLTEMVEQLRCISGTRLSETREGIIFPLFPESPGARFNRGP